MGSCAYLLALIAHKITLAVTTPRLHTDHQVLADQLLYACAWRENFNKCKILEEAYAEDASLRIAFGPKGGEETERQKLLDCGEVSRHDGQIRGRDAIIRFWETCVQLESWGAYQDAAWSRIAVDDDTVLVKGKVNFAHTFGETMELWRHSGDRWQLESTVLTVQEGHADAAGMGLREELCAQGQGEAAEPEAAQASAPPAATADAPTEAPPIADAVMLSGGGAGLDELGDSPTLPLSVTTQSMQEESSSSAASSVYFVIVALVVGVGASYMVHRARRRRSAQIAGFESMLG
ncbi:unnamed protein product [Prorocentrum cordatum]|uniref:SnoaL-like domain-containing protein n=1 Tax=Prorocentrum cordatum TaxID=2364126 RepID=A0ABN9PGQ5_9DINO|nr:unnamed protein product [Polarella glacialis]|mmetsp:Transcript_43660/g.117364  ORF Transcript_43660/g.117364 Transcript_43660/m.117364 type:complete len:292 (+) Transcript_43660:75-950(+)